MPDRQLSAQGRPWDVSMIWSAKKLRLLFEWMESNLSLGGDWKPSLCIDMRATDASVLLCFEKFILSATKMC